MVYILLNFNMQYDYKIGLGFLSFTYALDESRTVYILTLWGCMVLP